MHCFQVYNAVVLSAFTWLCICHHRPPPKSERAKLKPCTHVTPHPFLPSAPNLIGQILSFPRSQLHREENRAPQPF